MGTGPGRPQCTLDIAGTLNQMNFATAGTPAGYMGLPADTGLKVQQCQDQTRCVSAEIEEDLFAKLGALKVCGGLLSVVLMIGWRGTRVPARLRAENQSGCSSPPQAGRESKDYYLFRTSVTAEWDVRPADLEMKFQVSGLSLWAGLVECPVPYEENSGADSSVPPPSISLTAAQSSASMTNHRVTVRPAQSGCDGFSLLVTLSCVERQIFLCSAVVSCRVEVEVRVPATMQTLTCSGVPSWSLDFDGRIPDEKKRIGLVLVYLDLGCVVAVDRPR